MVQKEGLPERRKRVLKMDQELFYHPKLISKPRGGKGDPSL